MPYTLAHPAAAIPLRSVLGRYAVMSALIVGSMTPDLTHFFPVDVSRAQSHSLAGLCYFCIPMGLVLLLLYHAFVKRPITFLLPDHVRARLAPWSKPHLVLGKMDLVAVVISLAAGALTHIALDNLTDRQGPFAQSLPILGATAFRVFGYNIFVAKLAQHGTTLLGIVLLGYWCWEWLRASPIVKAKEPSPFSAAQRKAIRMALLLTPCIVGLAGAALTTHGKTPFRALLMFGRQTAIYGTGVLAALVLVYGVAMTLSEGRRMQATGSA